MTVSYPKHERGYFHLTGRGWVRQHGVEPLPDGCMETWRFESEQPSEDAKERVCLTRIWSSPGAAPETVQTLHARFGEPLVPTPDRNVILECDV